MNTLFPMKNATQTQAREWLLLMHSGEVQPQDYQAFKGWLQASSKNKKTYRDMEILWRQTRHTNEAEMYVAYRIKQQVPQTGYTSIKRLSIWASAIAASFLLLILPKSPFFDVAPASQVYEAPKTEIRSFKLDDGSEITLGAGSKVAVTLNNKSRNVQQLVGEVLYHVAKDPNKPFTVSVQGSDITVLGTIFDVQLSQSQTILTVAEGHVKVEHNEEINNLVKAQRVIIGHNGQNSEISSISLSQFANWQQKRFNFIAASLDDVVKTLNRYLPEPILFTHPSLKTRTITASFNINQIEQMLDTLNYSHKIQWNKDPQGVIWLSL
jgi:transmembrane sensor